jgi:hypothetical protein
LAVELFEVNKSTRPQDYKTTSKKNRIFVLGNNPCRLGEIALRNFVVERLRQKYCLSEASLFLSSEDDKILADLSAAASFFCFSFLR